MNSIDTSVEIKLTMSVATESIREFLDLILHINERNKICVDAYANLLIALRTCFLLHIMLKAT